MDLQVSTAHGTVIIRYGGEFNAQRQELAQKAFRLAAARAWVSYKIVKKIESYEEQKTLIAHQYQLITTGIVQNYTARSFHNLLAYPELADDPTNVRFDRKA